MSVHRLTSFASLLSILLIGLTVSSATAASSEFIDDDGSVHEPAIEAIAAAGLTVGCDELGERFCPNQEVTRGQIATFLVRALSLPPTTLDHFGDDNGTTHEDSINRIAELGITSGCTLTSYCPEQRLTRGQMATLLSRAMDLSVTSIDFFADDDTSLHETGINALANAGITLGCSSDSFCPEGSVTRGQMATFLARALGLTAQSADGGVLLVSLRPDRAGAVDLAGATLIGDVYIFVEPTLGTVARVRFYLDSSPGSAVAFQVENNQPYDLAGGSVDVADPFDASALAAGTHSVVAVLELPSGDESSLSASFNIAGSGPSVTTTTTTPPPTWVTTTTIQVSGGVVVWPGDDLEGLVGSYGAGTVFVLKPGVHRGHRLLPKDGMWFVGESGAVLDGEGEEFAFGGWGSDVRIEGLVIEGYQSPLQQAVVRYEGGEDWVVANNEVRFNGGIGIKAGPGWQVVDNFVHHNQQLGLAGSGGGILVEGNEIAFNNADLSVDPGWEAGGTKWVWTTDLVVRNNYSHDNGGPGLWTDIHNVGTLYEDNLVVGNYHQGIKHEVSCDAVIRNNTAIGNGFGAPGWLDGVGIGVINSPDVEVYGNTVTDNNDGIGGIQTDRSADPISNERCVLELRNLWVHDNTISMQVGHTGVVTNQDGSVYGWNNRFQNNTYTLGPNSHYYQWSGRALTTAEWKVAGHDTTGTWN